MNPEYSHIIDELVSDLGFTLNPDQEHALEVFTHFLASRDFRSGMILKGTAGTGKTFMIHLFEKVLNNLGYKVVLLAPTGRAAKVITRRTRRYAATIHRHIYTPVESGGGVSFQLKDNRDPYRTIYVLDEASMLGDGGGDEHSTGVLADFLRFVYSEDGYRKIIFVGDHVQLPPVGSSESPALNAEYLAGAYGMLISEAVLETVMRQEEGSDILYLANEIRDAMLEGYIPEIEPSSSREVEFLDRGYDALETYTGYFRSDDPDQVLFITYSNKLAVDVNKALRKMIWDTQEPIVQGELLMVVRNNYAWGGKKFPFIANGEMGIVVDMDHESYEEKYGLKWMDITIEFSDPSGEPVRIDCKVVLDLLNNKAAQLSYRDMKAILQQRRMEFGEMSRTKQAQEIRKDPYVNALQIKYGYAVTGHKAQGGQWKNVIIGFEPMYEGMETMDYLRWAYTSITRAEERLFILNFPFQKKEW